jgi:hypothetical protein
MKNVELVRGKCGICGGPIGKDWAGENPSLGTSCRNCGMKSTRPRVFRKDHLELNVAKQVVFDPLFGNHSYHFDFAGTKVMVNGKVGAIRSTQGDCSWVNFEGGTEWGDPIKDLGYQDLVRIHVENGGEMKPPTLNLREHKPQAVALLDKPIFPIFVHKENGQIQLIELDQPFREGLNSQMATMFHSFCNTFVRYRFGLAQNLCFEGGFIGRNFEVRNFMSGFSNSKVGVSVRHESMINQVGLVDDVKDFETLVFMQNLIDMSVGKEQQRIGKDRTTVLVENPSADLILSTWATTLETLMRYDWLKVPFSTEEEIWECYCTMQDVLLNIMAPEVLEAILKYARSWNMRHFGQSY